MEEKKKNCHNCGKEISEDYKFCPYCGAGDNAVASLAFAAVSGVIAVSVSLGYFLTELIMASTWFAFVFSIVTMMCGLSAAVFGALELKKEKRYALPSLITGVVVTTFMLISAVYALTQIINF